MDELTDAEQLELQTDLQTLRSDLEQLLENSQESSKVVDLEQPIGRLSRMDALQQQAMAKANRAGTERRLKLIESALATIRQGRYGECRRCEEPIGYPRLKVRPETPFCLACQEKREETR